jgi:hypothetical protein
MERQRLSRLRSLTWRRYLSMRKNGIDIERYIHFEGSLYTWTNIHKADVRAHKLEKGQGLLI